MELKVKDFRSNLIDFVGKNYGTNTVSRWLNNRQPPHLDTLYDIAEMLDVEICELLVKVKDLKEQENKVEQQ